MPPRFSPQSQHHADQRALTDVVFDAAAIVNGNPEEAP